ncbi:uncharacterized protein LOC113525117 [Pangasianodon hypophthalmus]|uniref:uncharacterized protein LOC113525117 n=1 Tax=Pangasianodon hypophthalmus TaxID=310915 RepID=UPI002308143E|nr:uncharacterized protein LOC113525117 [Pangasianodon hypophthalmus]
MTVLFFLLCSQLLLVGGVMTIVMEKNITLSCKNISAGDGYTYRVSPDILSALLHDEDCEQAWYNETGEFVSDGQLHANQSKHHLVVDANRENITVSECIKLQHHVTCHGSSKEWKHFYQVNNDTSSPAPITAQQSHHLLRRHSRHSAWTPGLVLQTAKAERWSQRLVRGDRRRSEHGRRQRADEESRMNPGDVRANGCVNGEEAQALKDNVTTEYELPLTSARR